MLRQSHSVKIFLSFLMLVSGIRCNLSYDSDPLYPHIPSKKLENYLYKSFGSCADNSLVFHFTVGTGMVFPFDPSVTMDVRTAQVQFYFRRDWTFEAQYQEFLGGLKVAENRFSGNYDEQGLKLVVGDIGEGEFIETENQLKLKFQFKRDLVTSGLAGMETILWWTEGESPLEPRTLYCEKH